MAYITIDFGSSNSGAVLNTAYGKDYNPADLIYVHRQDGDAGFTKQPTIFWVRRSLLEKAPLSPNDINIYSCVFYDKEKYFDSANFIWCNSQIDKALPILSKSNEWVRIQYPKMELYKIGNKNPNDTKIRTNRGDFYPLSKILQIFFMVVKKECMHRASEAGLILKDEDICWNITVPGLAIWNQDAVKVIKDIVYPILGKDVTLLSEPECALIGINISSKAEIDFVKDRYSIVADLGGGTADICVMKETKNTDGTTSFDEIKATSEDKDATISERAGGNDIDSSFISFFCEFLADGIDLNDEPITLFTKFLEEKPEAARSFNHGWHTIEFSDKIEESTIFFSPGREYMNWLKVHYPAAAKKVDEWGEFSLNGEELRNYVFEPVYGIILKSIEENLINLQKKGVQLDAIYYAGGLSLDKRLKNRIKKLVAKYYPYARNKETSPGAVVGAVQRGGNHLAVNKEKLVRRMSRRTFYTEFTIDYPGSHDSLKAKLGARLRHDYHTYHGIWLSDDKIREILNREWSNLDIDYSDGSVSYLTPLCLRFAPITQIRSFPIRPYSTSDQTAVSIKVYSSDKNFILFKKNNSDIKYEGEFNYDFNYNWESAKLFFDPTSNAVEGAALFYLCNESGDKLKEFILQNVSKRGL